MGQHFGTEVVERIRQEVGGESGLSRRALSQRVCEWLNWRGQNGALLEGSCRKALGVLEKKGVIELPPPLHNGGYERSPKPAPAKRVPMVRVCGSLESLGKVELVPVETSSSVLYPLWKTLLDREHPLGSGPLVGARLGYLIRSELPGYLGALAFSSASMHVRKRDEHIGWSTKVRRQNIHKVITNSRFLIVRTVCVPNLASHVLGLATRRVARDWQQLYGVRPGLVDTFVDPKHYAGTCYRAANWKPLGLTAGRSTAFANGKCSTGQKHVFIYPLMWAWRKYLNEWTEPGLLDLPGGDPDAPWMELEFARVQIYDSRLKRRLYQVACDFYSHPGELVPQASDGHRAKAKAAYRLMNNSALDLQTLLRSHVGEAIGRIREHRVVIAAQDTTTLNYGSKREVVGFGRIGTSQCKNVGLLVHDVVAFTEEGTPLGVLDANVWARDGEPRDKTESLRDLPIEAKESIKWLRGYRVCAEVNEHCPDTTLVVVGDRESDLYDLFHEVGSNPQGPEILVRAEKTRQRKVEGYYLWDRLEREDEAGRIVVEVPRRGKRAARQATLAIRFKAVRLQPPVTRSDRNELEDVDLWAVYVKEVESGPDVKEPLEWMLLTSVDTPDFEAAARRVSWYCQRWNIEIYHRILKSGCRVEDRQLHTTEAIEVAMGIDLVVAWRIHYMTKLGRETPNAPCTLVLEEDEWRALVWFVTKRPGPNEPIPLMQAIRLIAQLGGFLGRKSDGNPGTTVIWRGLRDLDLITRSYRCFAHPVRDGPNDGVTYG